MIDQLIAELSTRRNFFCDPSGVSEERILLLEKTLTVSLPPSYRSFLQACGFAMWFGHRICGISKLKECDVEYQTMKARQVELPDPSFRRVPDEGVVVEPYAGGGWYFLFSRNAQRSGEVALYSHDALGHEVQAWPSFEEFLSYKISVSS